MGEYMQFMAGIGIGAFASWIITHEYYRKSIIAPETVSADRLLVNKIEDVWAVITAPDNIRSLDWRSPKLILGETLQVGVELGCAISGTGVERKLFIVELNAPYDLSWGDNPTDWDTKVSLRKHPDGTRLVFTRKLWPLVSPWWVAIFDLFSHDKALIGDKELIDQDLHRIFRLFG